LSRIASLYRIETEIRGKSTAHRLGARQTDTRPLVIDLQTWFEAQLAKLPGRSRTAKAKEAALAKLKPCERGKRTRFHPSDRLLAFLEVL